jgi:hypothetical protein
MTYAVVRRALRGSGYSGTRQGSEVRGIARGTHGMRSATGEGMATHRVRLARFGDSWFGTVGAAAVHVCRPLDEFVFSYRCGVTVSRRARTLREIRAFAREELGLVLVLARADSSSAAA